ncbi:MAG: hypothetical protein ACJA02_000358 [Myxococcota bacterium]|jgi:hypothetical protein
MTKKSPNQKPTSKIKNQQTAQMMAKILNVSENEISDSMKLFVNIHPDLEKCLERLAEIEEKDYVSFFMMLEYFLFPRRPS